MIDNLTIQKIKDAADIVEVISDFYELRKDGTGYTCLCPFHEDRHLGSFKVSPRRNIYKCFSCDAQGGPVDFLMAHEKLTFTDAIRWLGKKYSIEVEGSERFTMKPCAPRKPTPPLPMLVLDKERFMYPTLGKENTLTRWLRGLNWSEKQRVRIDKVLKCYLVGTSKQGQTIFWQCDEKANCRTGKLMLYEDNGHRAKWPNGKAKGMGWIHSSLYKAGVLDPNTVQEVTCLFGLHLIDFAKPLTVNIVESEKTAIICTIMYGDMRSQLWLALGGKSNLTREKLQPLIDRQHNIVLYPDRDAAEEWKAKAKEIGYKHLIVNEEFMKMYWQPEDGEKADIADVLIRMITPKMDAIIEKYPALKALNDKFDLELIRIEHGEERQI